MGPRRPSGAGGAGPLPGRAQRRKRGPPPPFPLRRAGPAPLPPAALPRSPSPPGLVPSAPGRALSAGGAVASPSPSQPPPPPPPQPGPLLHRRPRPPLGAVLPSPRGPPAGLQPPVPASCLRSNKADWSSVILPLSACGASPEDGAAAGAPSARGGGEWPSARPHRARRHSTQGPCQGRAAVAPCRPPPRRDLLLPPPARNFTALRSAVRRRTPGSPQALPRRHLRSGSGVGRRGEVRLGRHLEEVKFQLGASLRAAGLLRAAAVSFLQLPHGFPQLSHCTSRIG